VECNTNETQYSQIPRDILTREQPEAPRASILEDLDVRTQKEVFPYGKLLIKELTSLQVGSSWRTRTRIELWPVPTILDQPKVIPHQ